MKTKGKPSRTRPRKRRRPVTAAQARRIAARFDAARRFDRARVESATPGLHLRGAPAQREVWLVFPVPPCDVIAPAEVIAVSKRTGKVVFTGSVLDEG